MLNENDSVIQYYVPYLSGVQIYADSVKSSAKSRQLRKDSDSELAVIMNLKEVMATKAAE